MNTISTYAIEAGARAIADAQNVPFVGRKQLLLVRAALTAAAPIIRADALREAANVVLGPSEYLMDAATCRLIAQCLRARADQIDGGSK